MTDDGDLEGSEAGDDEVVVTGKKGKRTTAALVLKGTAPKKEKAVAPLKIKLNKKKKRKRNSVCW